MKHAFRCFGADTLVRREANPELALEIFVDSGPLAMQASDERPLSKTARLRNRMLDAVNVSAFDYLLWIDADVVEYPATLPSLLISANPGGVLRLPWTSSFRKTQIQPNLPL